VSRRDHILVYVVRQFRLIGTKVADWEILETGFFDADALPKGTTKATRARLNEIRQGVPVASDW
jgi:hypothetical protein